MSNFWQRLLTGVVFVGTFITMILWSYAATAWLFFIIVLLGSLEFTQLIKKVASPQRWFGSIISAYASLTLFLSISLEVPILLLLAPIILGIVLIFVAELFRKATNPFQNIAFSIFPLFYLALPFGALFSLGLAPYYDIDTGYSSEIVLGFFLIIWANDTFAYLVGRQFGKHKLFERISPKKTWEGTLGGMLGALIIAFIISIYAPVIATTHWIVISLLITAFGSLGDLAESTLKRSLDVKDSGNILPGHGGILDRFDAVLLAAPIVALYLYIISSI